MYLRLLQTFAILIFIFTLQSKADDVILSDPHQGISSVEVLEDNIANWETPEIIGIFSHLDPRNEHSQSESVEDTAINDVTPPLSRKPTKDQKTGESMSDHTSDKHGKSKKKTKANRDKFRKADSEESQDDKPTKSKQNIEKSENSKGKKQKPDGDPKTDDSDVTNNDTNSEPDDDSTTGKSNVGKTQKNEKTAENSKSKGESVKEKDSSSKKNSNGKSKDKGKSSKKQDGKDSDSDRNPSKKKTKSDNDRKSKDKQNPDDDVTDDKAKKNKNKSEEGGKSNVESKNDGKGKSEGKSVETSDDGDNGDGSESKTDSKKVDNTPKKSRKNKNKKSNENADSDKPVEDDSKHISNVYGPKNDKKKSKKDSKKAKKKSKSQNNQTELEKSRDGVKNDGKSDNPDSDGRRIYSVESLKHLCDVIDDPPIESDSDTAATSRAFVPILTNKPEKDKSRRKKKKKNSSKHQFLFGCEDAKPRDITKFDGTGGIAAIYSQSSKSHILVYCDNTTLGGGWTVFQRRVDGTLDFDRGYGAYQRGFGDLLGEHWLGLDNMANITGGKDEYELRLEMTGAPHGKKMIANYGSFSMGSQVKGYRLRVDDFDGIRVKDVLVGYDGEKFSAFNQDETKSQCGSRLQSGFWFDNCSTSSPNGKYFISSTKSRRPSGIYWKPMAGKFGPISQIEMKFRKKE